MTGVRDVHDIDGVLAALRRVVDDAARAGSRIGLFAAVYRQVTAAVAQRLGEGRFDDATRLHRFDALFAGRYLSALAAWRGGQDPGRSWRLAFRAAEDGEPVFVQHVLLGINAHINLDLAVAAAQTSPGAEIAGLKADFDRVNEVLVDVLCRLQGALNDLSPLLGGLDKILGRIDEEILGFAIERARAESWEAAVRLAGESPEARQNTIRMLDRYAYGIGRGVLAPPFPAPAALQVIRFGERVGTAEAIERLDGALGL